MILQPRKIKSATVSTVSPSVCHEVIGPDAMFLIFLQFVVIHTVKGFGIVSKEEIDAFLELSCFFNDLADVSNLISGSSAFSKTSLNIGKFTVHILLKPGLENFEHKFVCFKPLHLNEFPTETIENYYSFVAYCYFEKIYQNSKYFRG